MPKFLQTLLGVLLLSVIGVAAYQYFNPRVVERVVLKEVPVKLTPTMLDSLRLGFQAEFKATLRPKIIKIADSTRIRALLGEIFALRDSLHGGAKLELTYDTDSLGKYRDTLHVSADFIDSTVSVVFRPKERNLTIAVRDTIRCPEGSPFWETMKDIGLVVGGVLVGRLGK